MTTNNENQTNVIENASENTIYNVIIKIFKKDNNGHLSFNREVNGEVKNAPAFIASAVNECVEKIFKHRPDFLSKAKPIRYELRVNDQPLFAPSMKVNEGGTFAEIGDMVTAKAVKKTALKEQIYADMCLLLDMISGKELENINSL